MLTDQRGWMNGTMKSVGAARKKEKEKKKTVRKLLRKFRKSLKSCRKSELLLC